MATLKIDGRATVTFLRDDVKYDAEGKFGESWNYWVESEGERYGLYASPALQAALMAAEVGRGMVATITKLKIDKGVRWEVDVRSKGEGLGITVKDWDGNMLDQSLLYPSGGQPDTTPVRPPTPSDPAKSNGVHAGKSNGLQDLAHLAQWAIDTAHDVWSGYDCGPDNIQGTASTLIIQASSKGLSAPSPEGALTAAVPEAFDGDEVPTPTDEDLPF